MSDNVLVKDATGATLTMKTTDTGGVHTPHQNVVVLSMPTTPVSGSVTATVANNLFYNETLVELAASATFTGAARDAGAAAGTTVRYAAFNAFAFASHAGTLRIECSVDNVAWYAMTANSAVAAGSMVILSVPVMARYHRAVYVNGATLQTSFIVNTSYTVA